jgi:hypothetical protein
MWAFTFKMLVRKIILESLQKSSKRKVYKARRELPRDLFPLASLVALANLATDELTERLARATDDKKRGEYERAGIIDDLDADRAAVERIVEAADREHAASREFWRAASEILFVAGDGILQMPASDGRKLYFLQEIADEAFWMARTLRTILRDLARAIAADQRFATVAIPSGQMPVIELSGGTLRVQTDLIVHHLLPALDGIDAHRLRICPVCDRLFVARRRDQLGCDAKCGNAEYMRRYRSPEKQRQYAQNKKINQVMKARRAELAAARKEGPK